MDFSLSDEHKLFRSTIRQFVDNEIRPATSQILLATVPADSSMEQAWSLSSTLLVASPLTGRRSGSQIRTTARSAKFSRVLRSRLSNSNRPATRSTSTRAS